MADLDSLHGSVWDSPPDSGKGSDRGSNDGQPSHDSKRLKKEVKINKAEDSGSSPTKSPGRGGRGGRGSPHHVATGTQQKTATSAAATASLLKAQKKKVAKEKKEGCCMKTSGSNSSQNLSEQASSDSGASPQLQQRQQQPHQRSRSPKSSSIFTRFLHRSHHDDSTKPSKVNAKPQSKSSPKSPKSRLSDGRLKLFNRSSSIKEVKISLPASAKSSVAKSSSQHSLSRSSLRQPSIREKSSSKSKESSRATKAAAAAAVAAVAAVGQQNKSNSKQGPADSATQNADGRNGRQGNNAEDPHRVSPDAREESGGAVVKHTQVEAMDTSTATAKDEVPKCRRESVQAWVNSISEERLDAMEEMEHQDGGAASAGEPAEHGHVTPDLPNNDLQAAAGGQPGVRVDDDDLTLGAEAKFLTPSKDIVLSRTTKHRLAGVGAASGRNRQTAWREMFTNIRTESFNSEGSAHSSRTRDSIEQLLQERTGDPEEILTNLGFHSQESDESLPSRIPERFLRQQSSASGISLEKFIESNPDLKEYVALTRSISEPSTASLASGSSSRKSSASLVPRKISPASKSFASMVKTMTFIHRLASKMTWKEVDLTRKMLAPVDSATSRLQSKTYAGMTPSGRSFRSILHPDNSEHLAEQGIYDDTSSRRASIVAAGQIDENANLNHEAVATKGLSNLLGSQSPAPGASPSGELLQPPPSSVLNSPRNSLDRIPARFSPVTSLSRRESGSTAAVTPPPMLLNPNDPSMQHSQDNTVTGGGGGTGNKEPPEKKLSNLSVPTDTPPRSRSASLWKRLSDAGRQMEQRKSIEMAQSRPQNIINTSNHSSYPDIPLRFFVYSQSSIINTSFKDSLDREENKVKAKEEEDQKAPENKEEEKEEKVQDAKITKESSIDMQVPTHEQLALKRPSILLRMPSEEATPEAIQIDASGEVLKPLLKGCSIELLESNTPDPTKNVGADEEPSRKIRRKLGSTCTAADQAKILRSLSVENPDILMNDCDREKEGQATSEEHSAINVNALSSLSKLLGKKRYSASSEGHADDEDDEIDRKKLTRREKASKFLRKFLSQQEEEKDEESDSDGSVGDPAEPVELGTAVMVKVLANRVVHMFRKDGKVSPEEETPLENEGQTTTDQGSISGDDVGDIYATDTDVNTGVEEAMEELQEATKVDTAIEALRCLPERSITMFENSTLMDVELPKRRKTVCAMTATGLNQVTLNSNVTKSPRLSDSIIDYQSLLSLKRRRFSRQENIVCLNDIQAGAINIDMDTDTQNEITDEKQEINIPVDCEPFQNDSDSCTTAVMEQPGQDTDSQDETTDKIQEIYMPMDSESLHKESNSCTIAATDQPEQDTDTQNEDPKKMEKTDVSVCTEVLVKDKDICTSATINKHHNDQDNNCNPIVENVILITQADTGQSKENADDNCNPIMESTIHVSPEENANIMEHFETPQYNITCAEDMYLCPPTEEIIETQKADFTCEYIPPFKLQARLTEESSNTEVNKDIPKVATVDTVISSQNDVLIEVIPMEPISEDFNNNQENRQDIEHTFEEQSVSKPKSVEVPPEPSTVEKPMKIQREFSVSNRVKFFTQLSVQKEIPTSAKKPLRTIKCKSMPDDNWLTAAQNNFKNESKKPIPKPLVLPKSIQKFLTHDTKCDKQVTNSSTVQDPNIEKVISNGFSKESPCVDNDKPLNVDNNKSPSAVMGFYDTINDDMDGVEDGNGDSVPLRKEQSSIIPKKNASNIGDSFLKRSTMLTEARQNSAVVGNKQSDLHSGHDETILTSLGIKTVPPQMATIALQPITPMNENNANRDNENPVNIQNNNTHYPNVITETTSNDNNLGLPSMREPLFVSLGASESDPGDENGDNGADYEQLLTVAHDARKMSLLRYTESDRDDSIRSIKEVMDQDDEKEHIFNEHLIDDNVLDKSLSDQKYLVDLLDQLKQNKQNLRHKWRRSSSVGEIEHRLSTASQPMDWAKELARLREVHAEAVTRQAKDEEKMHGSPQGSVDDTMHPKAVPYQESFDLDEVSSEDIVNSPLPMFGSDKGFTKGSHPLHRPFSRAFSGQSDSSGFVEMEGAGIDWKELKIQGLGISTDSESSSRRSSHDTAEVRKRQLLRNWDIVHNSSQGMGTTEGRPLLYPEARGQNASDSNDTPDEEEEKLWNIIENGYTVTQRDFLFGTSPPKQRSEVDSPRRRSRRRSRKHPKAAPPWTSRIYIDPPTSPKVTAASTMEVNFVIDQGQIKEIENAQVVPVEAKTSGKKRVSYMNLLVSHDDGKIEITPIEKGDFEVPTLDDDISKVDVSGHQVICSLLRRSSTAWKPDDETMRQCSIWSSGESDARKERRTHLLEEVKLIQHAITKFKVEFRALDLRTNSIYNQYPESLSQAQQSELEELKELRSQIMREIRELELRLGDRIRLLLSESEGFCTEDLSSLHTVHQVVEVLKEQVYHSSVIHGMAIPGVKAAEAEGEAEVSAELSEQLSVLQSHIEDHHLRTSTQLNSTMDQMKETLMAEVRQSVSNETDELRRQVQVAKSEVNHLKEQLRNRKTASPTHDPLSSSSSITTTPSTVRSQSLRESPEKDAVVEHTLVLEHAQQPLQLEVSVIHREEESPVMEPASPITEQDSGEIEYL